MTPEEQEKLVAAYLKQQEQLGAAYGKLIVAGLVLVVLLMVFLASVQPH